MGYALQSFITIRATCLFEFFQLGVQFAPLVVKLLWNAEVVVEVVTTERSKPAVWLIAGFQP